MPKIAVLNRCAQSPIKPAHEPRHRHQHTRRTTPGPIAGYPWTERSLLYVLGLGVPPAKVSLGIAAYCQWWYPSYETATGARVSGKALSFPTATAVLADAKTRALWDDRQRESMAVWESNGMNEFLAYVDARAFEKRLGLARLYNLRGYSVWVLGLEDPAIWHLKYQIAK